MALAYLSSWGPVYLCSRVRIHVTIEFVFEHHLQELRSVGLSLGGRRKMNDKHFHQRLRSGKPSLHRTLEQNFLTKVHFILLQLDTKLFEKFEACQHLFSGLLRDSLLLPVERCVDFIEAM